MIGLVLLHEKKTQSTYSLFGGTLKSLEPELKNLMAFGTDDEKALVGGFNETFERATCLPYEIHLCKNIDTKLLSMDIKGESKQSVMDDIFGRKIGSVFESRLSDAGSAENFFGLFESLEEKWSSLHSNGSLPLLVWLEKHEEFTKSPSESWPRFPTRQIHNQSIWTHKQCPSGLRECGTVRIDEYTLVKTLEKLLKSQEQELELAVLDKGK